MQLKCYLDISPVDSVRSAALLSLPECELLESASAAKPENLLRLVFEKGSWHFCLPHSRAKVAVEFSGIDFARRLAEKNLGREFVVRAIRGRSKCNYNPMVFDATAGFGRDAFLLAASGCQVVQVERLPLLAFLLEQALAAAAQSSTATIAKAAGRCRVISGDSVQIMQGWRGEAPDIVYLDPMYLDPELPVGRALKATAAVKKNMQTLHLLSEIYQANYASVENSPGGEALFAAATSLARSKVVVKRAPAAPPLADVKPSSCLSGKAARFDIYAL